MNYKTFEKCFESLCLSFDLDITQKKNRMEYYFDSKLGDLSEHVFLEVIKTAKQTLEIRPGYLPAIKTLEDIFYSRPKTNTYREESFNTAICNICDNIGMVTLWKDGYIYGGFCCTCPIGREKQVKTQLGREQGLYIDAFKRGFTLSDESLPKEVPF
jgi:hypothetical protein